MNFFSEAEVKDWYTKLFRMQLALDQWGKVQSTWLYLLPIFSSKYVVAQMPDEGRLYVNVDQTYKRYMQLVAQDSIVIKIAPQTGLLESMQMANEMLEKITVGVNNYLEKKRLYFPRFFFLSNDEMLEILSETKDPLKVQPHLIKCFEGINRLEFNESLEALAMISVEKEKISFINKVSTENAQGSVEKWLFQVEEEMLLAIKTQTADSYSQYSQIKRDQWMLNWPGMVILCVSQIFWAAEIQDRLKQSKIELLKEQHKILSNELIDTVAVIRSKSISNINRISIKALITIDVHAKDVVEDLIKRNVVSEHDFSWLSQLRYYMVEEKVMVHIINAEVPFAFEYLGNSERLVITPLTGNFYLNFKVLKTLLFLFRPMLSNTNRRLSTSSQRSSRRSSRNWQN